jgi:hypothetical protein
MPFNENHRRAESGGEPPQSRRFAKFGRRLANAMASGLRALERRFSAANQRLRID